MGIYFIAAAMRIFAMPFGEFRYCYFAVVDIYKVLAGDAFIYFTIAFSCRIRRPFRRHALAFILYAIKFIFAFQRRKALMRIFSYAMPFRRAQQRRYLLAFS